ncbi:hypothetical protein G647_00472 [Cladophialophora carrionii CBS 160.54]|uniref:Uncharacterized protein n=1 Tax=Cladophialophora carrionii CBS 160.54 TaxID=1279043 RepID=V9DNY5_9EURO|nr:uncharacterized protein G647_00472 [Cladophialophora carrionii CBS 160.54]ETI28023.1 hypothetical protein G647_00472 [Cladophialophora carrionii CBS 160.54]
MANPKRRPPASTPSAPITVLSDGQPQAPTGVAAASTSSVAPAAYTGAAHRPELAGGLAAVAGIAGLVVLL